MSETIPAYLTGRTTAEDNRDWLKAQLSQGVERAPGTVQEFLEALHWRQRSVVVLCFAEHMTQERVGWLLGIHSETVRRDIRDVCTLVQGLTEK